MWVQRIPGGGVDGLVYAPDGRTLYVADRSGTVVAWNVATREGQWLFDSGGHLIRGLAFAAQRYLLAKIRHSVRVWDVAAGAGVAWQPIWHPQDDLHILRDGRIVYQSADRLSLLARSPSDTGEGVPFAAPFTAPVRAYDVSPDGRTVALVHDSSRYVSLFDIATGSVTVRSPLEFDSGLVWGVRFAPSGDTLAAFSGSQVRLCDTHTLACRTGRVNIDNRHGQAAFAFHPLAPLFVALNSDGVLTLLSTETGEPMRSLDFALGRRVRCGAFAPDGLTCAIGGSNKQFAVFDVDV